MAYIDENTIKKIRESIDIVDLIGEYLPLVQRGKNYFAVCPFHDDHSPSMSISKEKQIYRCFVCGAGGNVFTFIQEYLKVPFNEAVAILGKKVGFSIDIKEKKVNNKYKNYYDIYSLALSYYKNNLYSKEGIEARRYLENRKLTQDVIDYFDIGLSIGNGLVSSLKNKYDTKTINDIGLSNDYGNDIFTNRIMFPIKDLDGNVVAFTGRIFNTNSNSKYVNSKESVIFKKGNILYNYSNALDSIRKKREVIISEGNMEVIRLHTIGIDNAIALMGTSFTKEQLDIIKNLRVNVILNLDQDDAGKIGTISIGNMFESVGISTSVIIFSKYKDADELISNEGESAFKKAYESRISFLDFKLDYLKKNKDLSNAEDLSKYLNESIKVINSIDDDILKELKIKELSKKYQIEESLIRNKVVIKKEVIKRPFIEKKRTKYNKYDISEIRLIYLMLNNPSIIDYFENNLGYMNNESRKRLSREIILFKINNKGFDYANFISYIANDKELNDALKEVLEFNQIDEYTTSEVEDYVSRIRELKVKIQIDSLNKKLKDTIDVEEKKKILSRIEKMKKDVLKW